MGVPKSLRFSLHSGSGWFVDEARAAALGIPVVVEEVMESTLGNRAPAAIRSLESDSDIERRPGHFTSASGDYARWLVERSVDGTFMRMRGKIADHAGGGSAECKDRMERSDRNDLLIIAVGAGVIVRPGDVL